MNTLPYKPPEPGEDAVKRAMYLMQVAIKDLPPPAIAIRNHLARMVGMCMEVCITAFAAYAQVVEGLPCTDDLYIVQTPEEEFLKAEMAKG
jgi:hypothetical protein